jgi:hypothetical protein
MEMSKWRERAGFRFQSDLVPGTKLWEYQKGHAFTIPLVMEIFYKPGIYSISMGQSKNLISEPTKPAIFDFMQGAFHS